MIKTAFIILFVLSSILPTVSALTNETECVGGIKVITPLNMNDNDTYFSIFNDGSYSYLIYSNNTGYIATLSPKQTVFLSYSNNYVLYGEYQDIRDFEDATIITEKMFKWWYPILIMLVFVIGIYAVFRVITRRR